MSDKPLPATPQRLQKAREEGNVPHSKDALSLGVLVVVFEILFACFDTARDRWNALMRHTLDSLSQPFASIAPGIVADAFTLLLVCSAVVLAGAALAGIAAAAATSGLTPAPKALSKGVEKMNPANFFQQFTAPDTWIAVALGIVNASVIATVVFIIVHNALPTLPLLSQGNVAFNWDCTLRLVKLTVRSVLGSMVGLTLFDTWLKRSQWQKRLRMDYQEMKQEIKESAGDPLVKSAFRQRAIEAAQEAHQSNMARANAVVVNPEHYAVALYYEDNETPLPLVVDKGVDDDAQAIIVVARADGIPIIRYRALARRLYATAQIDHGIPAETFKAVALLYRVIEEIRAGNLSAAQTLEIEDETLFMP